MTDRVPAAFLFDLAVLLDKHGLRAPPEMGWPLGLHLVIQPVGKEVNYNAQLTWLSAAEMGYADD